MPKSLLKMRLRQLNHVDTSENFTPDLKGGVAKWLYTLNVKVKTIN